MGKYDNFDNHIRIKSAEKRLAKLKNKKKQDLFQIEIAQKELEIAKMFESCQIFGSEGFFASEHNPNSKIMFSDDNRVMMFFDKLVRYEDIVSFGFGSNIETKAHTKTKTKGALSRAIVGGVIAGEIGAIVGAASAGSSSDTQYYNVENGFIVYLTLKNGQTFSCVQSWSNRPSRKWKELYQKVQMIIEDNK